MDRESAKPPVRGKTSPFGFFVKMCYEEHKKRYPNENVQVTEISKKCSEKWKTMTDNEKRRFSELAQKDAERYQAEVAAYGGKDAIGTSIKQAEKAGEAGAVVHNLSDDFARVLEVSKREEDRKVAERAADNAH